MARRSAKSAVSSWCCADVLNCLATQALRSTAASSSPSPRGTGIYPSRDAAETGADHEGIARYLSQVDSADRQGEAVPAVKIIQLNAKIATLRQEIQRLNSLNTLMMQTKDKQISLTDSDARSMATSSRGSGTVGYNVQSAVDTRVHLIVVHEVTNVDSDRSQLSRMTERARAPRLVPRLSRLLPIAGTIAAGKSWLVNKPARQSTCRNR
jgi:hypothetical protein